MSTKINTETLVDRLYQLTEDVVDNNMIPRFIYELEMAKQRLVNAQLMMERQAAIKAGMQQIVPANGSETLPPAPGTSTR